VLAAGAHATTGSGLPFAGLSAALVAEMVGRAPRQ
jgi:UDP-galactopyranose mutase